MAVTIPAAAVAVLVILSIVAKERKYDMTSAGLMVLTVAVLGWLAGLYWSFG